MSVVVIAEGPPTVDLLDEATTAANRLKTKLVVVNMPAAFSADTWTAGLAELLPRLEPHLVFALDDAHTRAFFPALAARLGRALLSSATRVLVKGERAEVERPIHGGLQTERLVVGLPLFVSLQTANRTPARSSDIASITMPPSEVEPRDAVRRVIPPDAHTVDIRNAERIVAGGLGLGSKEAVATLRRLAKPLRAAIGGTRVISDRGWLEHERYIGSTGKTVAPKLYLALGISGASQHLVGITESEAIVAINTDRAAPIFVVADLGIVGDLHAIIPELEKRLAKELE